MNGFQSQNEVILTWSIKNFCFCPQEKCEYLCSPTFYTKHFYDATWRLFLYPKGSSESQVNHIACNLDATWPDYASDSLPIELEIGIVDESGLCNIALATKGVLFWRDTVLRCPNLANRKEIFNNREIYVPNDTLTIRCHISGHCNSKYPLMQYFTRTTINVERCVFRWAINDFLSWNISDTLHIPIPSTLKFKAVTYLMSNNHQNEQIAIDICQIECEKYSMYLTSTISLLDCQEIPQESQTKEYLFEANGRNTRKIVAFLHSKTRIIDEKHLFLRDGALYLQCAISLSRGKPKHSPITICKKSKTALVTPPYIDTLRLDLQRMYEEKKFSDIVLKAGGEFFSAHKALLSVRSPVFRAMFEQDMAENTNGIVDISDVDANTLNYLLKYMYSGTLEVWDCEDVSKLLLAADKYQVLGLREKCVLVLKSNLSVETVCEILVLADFQEMTDLKTAAIEFILENHREVLQSNQWNQFIDSYRTLSTDILKILSTNF